MTSDDIGFAICICTRNRPEELTRALHSVESSELAPREVVVSDDSTDDRTRAMVADRFPRVRYVEGPRRGLCANRNVALTSTSQPFICFIDDDVVMAPDFLTRIAAELLALTEADRSRSIVTGRERNNGAIVAPSSLSFLGYQSKAYAAGEALHTVVINSTCFPASLFEQVRFDENLVYGSDEVDVVTRAAGRGFRVRSVPLAINDHYPSETNRDYYREFKDASRLYVTLKRYALTERHYGKALAYCVLAPAHLLLHRLLFAGRESFASTFRSVNLMARYVARSLSGDPRQR